MQLTNAQKKTLKTLKTFDTINCGVVWFGYRSSEKFPGRRYSVSLDGRVCNALVKKGLLVPVEGTETQYKLVENV